MSAHVPHTLLGDGLTVSAMGFGAMGISANYGRSDEREAVATLVHAVDHGLTFIDTAESYGPFENEKVIGRALAGRRHEVVLATKASAEMDDDGTILRPRNGTPAYIRRAAERSLRHLNTDHIDLYYLHRADPHVPIEESIGGMAELVAEGKVLHVGLSEVSATTIRRAHAVHPLAAVQTEFSLFARDVLHNDEKAVMDELGIGLVASSPLGRGALTDALTSVGELDDTDIRRNMPRFRPEAFSANRRLVDRLRAVALDKGASVSQVSLAWVMANGAVPIPGTRRRSRVDENIAACEVDLTAADLEAIAAAVPERQVSGDRNVVQVPAGSDR